MTKVLAVDYGTKKIGLAISDELGMVTAKLPVLHIRRKQDALDGIRYILHETTPELILIGMPYGSNGEENDQTKIVQEFVNELRNYLQKDPDFKSIEIKFWDESFSTQIAEQGKSRKFKREKSDSEAARIFLQEFLDSPERKNIN